MTKRRTLPGGLVQGLTFLSSDDNNDDENDGDENTKEDSAEDVVPIQGKVKSVVVEIHHKKRSRTRKRKTQGDLVEDLIEIRTPPNQNNRRNSRSNNNRGKSRRLLTQKDAESSDSSFNSVIFTGNDDQDDDDYCPSNSDDDDDGSMNSKEMIPSDDDDDDDDESDNYILDDDDDQVVKKSNNIGYVNDDFLDSDDTDNSTPKKSDGNRRRKKEDDDNNISKRRKSTRALRNVSKRFPQPTASTRKPSPVEYYSSSESNNESDDDEEETLTPSRKSKYYPIHCPSKADEITFQPFHSNKPHVCYLAPDGKTRHCYHLETLYRASIITGLRKYDEHGKMQLLQPPHFSQIMNDDVMDQIATRFGRQALSIEDSKIYKQIVLHGEQEPEAISNYHSNDDDYSEQYDGSNFEERINRYFQDLLTGRGDLYCCPLCYTQAHYRYQDDAHQSDRDSDSDDDNSSADEKLPDINFKHDPMEVLGALDDGKYEIAGTFCFKRVSQVKKHLRQIHNVDTSTVDGNDLYRRFQIRATDGLLQRFLLQQKASYRKELFENGTVMRSYWARGHSQTYIALISHVEECGEKLGESLGAEEVHPFVVMSSREKEKSLWDQIQAPFAVENADAMDDFIANENEEVEYCSDDANEEEEDENAQQDPMEKMIAELKRRRKKRRGSNMSSSSSSSSRSSSSSNNSPDDSVHSENDLGSGADNSKQKYNESSSEDELTFGKPSLRMKKLTPKERILSQRNAIMHTNSGDSSEDDEIEVIPSKRTNVQTGIDVIDLNDSD